MRRVSLDVTPGVTYNVIAGCQGGKGQEGAIFDDGAADGGGGGFGVIRGGTGGNGSGDVLSAGGSGGGGGGGASGVATRFPLISDSLLLASAGSGGGGGGGRYGGGGTGGAGDQVGDRGGGLGAGGGGGLGTIGGSPVGAVGGTGGSSCCIKLGGGGGGGGGGVQGGGGGGGGDFGGGGGGGGAGGNTFLSASAHARSTAGYGHLGGAGGVVLITPVWSKSPTTTTVTVPVGAVFDGNPKTATAQTVDGEGNVLANPAVTYQPGPGAPVNAGTYTASASYLGDDTYAGSSDSKPFTIFRAASNTEVTVADAVYDGNPHGGTAKVTGAGGLDQALTVSYSGRNGTVYGPSPTAPTNAGDYTASAIFTGDANHSGTSESRDYSIAKAPSTTKVTVADATYDGNPHGGTAKVTGAGGLDQALTVSYSGRNGTVYGPSPTAPTNAGDYTAERKLRRRLQPHRQPRQRQLLDRQGAVDDEGHGRRRDLRRQSARRHREGHRRRRPRPGADGQLQRPQRDRLRTSPTAPTNAGDYTASASYGGDSNHTGSLDSANYSIAKAPSTTKVTVADATYDGNPHGGTAKVTGAGGLDQALTVSYSGRNGTVYGPSPTAPTNAGDYTAERKLRRRLQPHRQPRQRQLLDRQGAVDDEGHGRRRDLRRQSARRHREGHRRRRPRPGADGQLQRPQRDRLRTQSDGADQRRRLHRQRKLRRRLQPHRQPRQRQLLDRGGAADDHGRRQDTAVQRPEAGADVDVRRIRELRRPGRSDRDDDVFDDRGHDRGREHRQPGGRLPDHLLGPDGCELRRHVRRWHPQSDQGGRTDRIHGRHARHARQHEQHDQCQPRGRDPRGGRRHARRQARHDVAGVQRLQVVRHDNVVARGRLHGRGVRDRDWRRGRAAAR